MPDPVSYDTSETGRTTFVQSGRPTASGGHAPLMRTPWFSSEMRVRRPAVDATDTAALVEMAAGKWKEDTAGFSSITKKTRHPSYAFIIMLGAPALTPLLQKLGRELDHWFPALRRISGEDPVPLQHRGNMHEMREAWLDWGRRKGLI